MIEILAPVGNKTMLAAAINARADAVYFGIKGINMRAGAKNFEINEIDSIVKMCHDNNVKAYLTVNTIVYDNEIEKIKNILIAARKAKMDAIICWDMAVIKLCNELKLPINISTQASVSNYEAVKMFQKLGAKAVVLARELSLEQIKEIITNIKKDKLDIKIECFIHGAMCVAVSGRCFMSQFAYGKSANRGECIQPCRREYIIEDVEKEYKLKLGNNYVMSPKDLCTVPIIDKLISAGIDILKIEGRNRNPEYVSHTVEIYRKLRDSIASGIKGKDLEKLKEESLSKLEKVYHRNFHTGFYLGTPTSDDWHNLHGSASKTKKQYIGYVKNYYAKINVAEVLIESHELKIGDNIMIQGPSTGTFEQKLEEMQLNHKNIELAVKQTRAAIKVKKQCRPNDKIFTLSY